MLLHSLECRLLPDHCEPWLQLTQINTAGSPDSFPFCIFWKAKTHNFRLIYHGHPWIFGPRGCWWFFRFSPKGSLLAAVAFNYLHGQVVALPKKRDCTMNVSELSLAYENDPYVSPGIYSEITCSSGLHSSNWTYSRCGKPTIWRSCFLASSWIFHSRLTIYLSFSGLSFANLTLPWTKHCNFSWLCLNSCR